MLVAVLSACTGAGVPLNLEVSFIELDGLGLQWIDDCDSYGGGVNPTSTFSRWDSLDAVPASLVVELCQIRTVYFQGKFALTAVQQAGSSADALRVGDVGLCQVLDEQLAVFSAFGGANFDDALHFTFLRE